MKTACIPILILAFCFITLIPACEYFDQNTEGAYLDQQQVLTTADGRRALISEAYNQLQQADYYGRDMILIPDLLADNARLSTIHSGRYYGAYHNETGQHLNIWLPAFKLIVSCNQVLAHVADKEQSLAGEALFLRALAYSDLLRIYAPSYQNHTANDLVNIPLILSNNAAIGQAQAGSSQKAIYDAIETDLLKAIEYLAKQGLPYSANRLAAQALLARVYLYRGLWYEAAEMASRVIAESKMTLAGNTNYFEIFEKENEALFALKFSVEENLATSSLQAYCQRDNGMGLGEICLSDNLVAQYAKEDIRYEMLLFSRVNNEPVVWTKKYGGYGGQFGQDHVTLLRLSEQYLIRAEAHARLGNEILAIEDLNRLRHRAGLLPYDLRDKELASAIQAERCRELAFEGHRFFDLKRLGQPIDKSINGQPVGLSVGDFRFQAPIPVSELSQNPYLKQNQGY